MMHGIWQDFIRYVMHVDVKVNRPAPAAGAPVDGTPVGAAAPAGAAPPADAPAALAGDGDGDDAALRDVQYSSPDDPSSSGGAASMAAAARAQAAATGEPAPSGGNGATTVTATKTNTPVVKSEWDKTPRNAPCPCGSGKKYKLCHGKH
jgi:preprotein translocase subunit SecA